jgi:ADP-ribose pyrophosphatase
MSIHLFNHAINTTDVIMTISDPHLTETFISGEQVYKGHFLQVERDVVAMPDGKEAAREYIKHPGAVVILPLFEDGNVLLERQFRYPLNRVFVEFPAGKIDYNEDPLVCAKRELLEETGYTASSWQFVCTIHNAIAYSDEHLDIYLAKGLTEGEAQLDEGEFLEVYRAPLSDLMASIQSGSVTDVKTIIGAFWLEKILAGTWHASDVVSG